jgi:hypothetical protein
MSTMPENKKLNKVSILKNSSMNTVNNKHKHKHKWQLALRNSIQGHVTTLTEEACMTSDAFYSGTSVQRNISVHDTK